MRRMLIAWPGEELCSEDALSVQVAGFVPGSALAPMEFVHCFHWEQKQDPSEQNMGKTEN